MRADKEQYKVKLIELDLLTVRRIEELAKKSKLGKFKPYVEALIRKHGKKAICK